MVPLYIFKQSFVVSYTAIPATKLAGEMPIGRLLVSKATLFTTKPLVLASSAAQAPALIFGQLFLWGLVAYCLLLRLYQER